MRRDQPSDYVIELDRQDWKRLVVALPTKASNPTGHFIDFFRERAREVA